MNVCRNVLDVVFVDKSSLVEATKESDLQLSLTVLVTHDLGWPVGKPFLLGVHDPMKRPTGLRKPMFVSSVNTFMTSHILLMTAIIPGVGVSVAVSACGQLSDVIDAVPEHLAGLVSHGAVGPVVDHHVVHDVLDVRLVLLEDPVLDRLALGQHLVQVDVSFQKKLCSPLFFSETCKSLSVRRVNDPVFSNRGFSVLKYTGGLI